MLALLAIGLAARGAGAAGTSAQAAREFDRASAAAARGDYLDAAAGFMRAYKLAPHAAPLYNAALAWEAAGDRPRAADGYATALEMGGLGEGQARDASKRLDALERTLGRIDVVGPAGTKVSVAHADRVDTPAHIHLEKGEHTLRAWLPDGRTELKQLAVAIGTMQVTLDREPRADAAPAPSRSADGPSQATAEPGSLRAVGWAALGVGVVAGGVTAYLGVQALGARNDYYDSGRTDRDAYDRAGSYRTWTNVALATSLVMAGTGVVILLKSPARPTDGRATSSESARMWLGGGPGSVVLGGRF
ncbi:MAG: hypothetical protein HY898_20955 [Deltaproteobacteria bacterium]|nr:hypothetical protein [Deltaproteobacteria bacterium]